MRLFYLWASLLLAEVRSRLESEHDRISYSTWRCFHSVSPCVTLCSCFSHHLQLLKGPSLCSHPFSSAPTLPSGFTPPPAPLLSVPFSPGVLLGACWAMSPDTWKQQDFPGGRCWQVFLSLPGLSHRLPVPVCTAALLCHVLWPPQRQREASAAGHRDIDPLQRPHLPDLNNWFFLANSTFYDRT